MLKVCWRLSELQGDAKLHVSAVRDLLQPIISNDEISSGEEEGDVQIPPKINSEDVETMSYEQKRRRKLRDKKFQVARRFRLRYGKAMNESHHFIKPFIVKSVYLGKPEKFFYFTGRTTKYLFPEVLYNK